ncbi:MAG TPA: hypothetical protein VGF56_13090 [Rhizomicrobium sp.]|jgi:hypothetical protein
MGGSGGRWERWRHAWPLSQPRAEGAAVLLAIPILLSIAIWNRFPLIFYDTGAYILQGLGGAFVEERSPVYSLFLPATGGFLSLWLVAIAQAAMTAFVMVETARALAPRATLPVFLLIAAVLCVITGMPWYAGQIEPDSFTAVVVLAFYLLLFHGSALSRGRRIALFLIAAVAIACHPSHLVLAVGLIACALLYWIAARRGIDWPPAHVALPALSLALAVVLIVTANFAFTGQIFISRAGPSFVFARLVQDGIVMRTLEDTCPQSGYRLCAYVNEMPRTADQWMWDKDTPFKKLKGIEGTNAESERIILDSLRRYPLMHVRTAASDTARQFSQFKTGDQLEPQEWVLYPIFKRLVPRQLDAYMHARQQKGEFDFRRWNAIHVTVGWISIIVLAAMLFFFLGARRHRQAVFLGFIFLGLWGNAAVCGALSNPHDRYQSRIVWIASFALALSASRGWRRGLRGDGESGTPSAS